MEIDWKSPLRKSASNVNSAPYEPTSVACCSYTPFTAFVKSATEEIASIVGNWVDDVFSRTSSQEAVNKANARPTKYIFFI